MSVTSQNNSGSKWINAGVAIASISVAYVFLVFFQQLGEWFELEARIPHFAYTIQGICVIAGLVLFVTIKKRKDSSSFLEEVYGEMLKVVWPNKSETARHTVGVIIGVTIAGLVLGLFDFLSSIALKQLN